MQRKKPQPLQSMVSKKNQEKPNKNTHIEPTRLKKDNFGRFFLIFF
jgi:hypothetical protein